MFRVEHSLIIVDIPHLADRPETAKRSRYSRVLSPSCFVMSGSFFVHDLVAMGFDRARAEKAVLHTHNRGVEPAIQWLVDHGDDGDIDIPIDFAVGN